MAKNNSDRYDADSKISRELKQDLPAIRKAQEHRARMDADLRQNPPRR